MSPLAQLLRERRGPGTVQERCFLLGGDFGRERCRNRGRERWDVVSPLGQWLGRGGGAGTVQERRGRCVSSRGVVSERRRPGYGAEERSACKVQCHG